jgi:uncharacterized protein YceK
MRNLLIAFALMLALGGCASIIKGTSQSIAIATPPTEGATCTLSSSQGSWVVTSPGVATVDKSKEDIQVRCVKPGWHDGFSNIPSNFEGWAIGNILAGGIIGVGVDAATGAINEYPHSFQVPMTPDTPTPAPSPSVQPPSALPPPRGRSPGA